MCPLVASLLFVALQVGGASSSSSLAAEGAAAPTGSATAAAAAPVQAPVTTATTDDHEARDVASLRERESRFAAGLPPTSADIEALVAAIERARSARARAVAAAVLAWLDPAVATDPLVRATRDADARVRASAAQSLVSLARRLPSERASAVGTVAIALLDDPEDEVACVAAELLVSVDAPAARQAFEVRGNVASDVRFTCYARFGGLPMRPVYMPPLPGDSAPSATPSGLTPGSTMTATPGSTEPVGEPAALSAPAANWIVVATAAGAGLLAGAALPGAVVPSRDVLVYDDDASRLTRQEVSFLTQAGAGVVGAALLGVGAWGGEQLWGRLGDDEAIVFAGASGAGAALGAGLGLVLGADGGGQALTLSVGTLAGVGVGAASTWGGRRVGKVGADDAALVLSAATLGTMGGALAAFSAVPVGVESVGAAQRTDFGLGAGLAGAGAAALGAVVASPFVDVAGPRLAAVTAGGLAGGGLLTAVGFLVVPRDLNVASRVACGMGLAGEVAGAALAGWLLPDAWLVQPGAVAVLGHDIVFGALSWTAFSPLPGSAEAPLGAVVAGRF